MSLVLLSFASRRDLEMLEEKKWNSMLMDEVAPGEGVYFLSFSHWPVHLGTALVIEDTFHNGVQSH